VKITLYVCKSHSTYINHTRACEITLCVQKLHSCVWTSHFDFRNYTRACVLYSMRVNITHNCDFYTQSVALTRMSFIISFVSVIITLIRVIITLIRVNITCLVRVEIRVVSVVITFIRFKITLCVWTSHYACEHHTMHALNQNYSSRDISKKKNLRL
jgi:hypothetical protein